MDGTRDWRDPTELERDGHHYYLALSVPVKLPPLLALVLVAGLALAGLRLPDWGWSVLALASLAAAYAGMWAHCRRTGFCYYRVEMAPLPGLGTNELGERAYLMRRFSAQAGDAQTVEMVQWESDGRIERPGPCGLIDGRTAVLVPPASLGAEYCI